MTEYAPVRSFARYMWTDLQNSLWGGSLYYHT